ncbi:glycosyltransferase [Sinomonas albida]|uniref:glycosyltransferase n=1 Tax=Sinomonas albida TaxID=369942 RepID=UPI0030188082
MSITYVVTVTYADRFEKLARHTVSRALLAGAAHVVLVDNGSSNATQCEISATYENESRVTVILLPENTGSAPGFACGIEAAILENPEFILLLDDDNWIESDTLARFHASHAAASLNFADDLTSISGFRDLDSDHSRLSTGMPSTLVFPPVGSFMFFDLFNEIKRRLKRSRPVQASQWVVPYGPYGGFFFPTPLIAEIGLPPKELKLYADDTVWTSGITARGHNIVLDLGVTIHDADGKWARTGGTGPLGLLQAAHQEKLFYSVRNRVYFERTHLRTVLEKARYSLNRTIYIVLVEYLSRRYKLRPALNTFRRAVVDGEDAKFIADNATISKGGRLPSI